MDHARADGIEATPPRAAYRAGWRRRVAIGLGGAAAVIAIVAGGLWVQREPIARDTIDRVLRNAGVPGRYTITRFSLASQTIENVALGDPVRPDLVARRATVHLRYRFGWPVVTGIEAEGVRLRGRIAGGRLSLGTVDRLLPAGKGGATALPDLDVLLADAAVALDTPVGAVRLAIDGRGNLANGFRGTIGLAMPRGQMAGCGFALLSGQLAVQTAAGAPRLTGPIGAPTLVCDEMTLQSPAAAIDMTLGPALDRWRGAATLGAGAVAAGGIGARDARGRVSFDGDAMRTRGDVRLVLGQPRGGGVAAASAGFEGRYALAGRTVSATGTLDFAHAAVATAPAARALAALSGTPAGPALAALSAAMARAGRDVSGSADVTAVTSGPGATLTIRHAAATAASGATLLLNPAAGARAVATIGGRTRLALRATVDGGGLPAARIDMTGEGGTIAGIAAVAPIAAGGSRVELAPVRFARGARGLLRFASALTLDGPVGDGRVEGLTLPIAGEASGAGLVVNRACVPLGFRSLAIAGTLLGPGRLGLCPLGVAMIGPGGGGVRVPDAHIAGRVGQAPLDLRSGPIAIAFGRPGFTVRDLAVRLGEGADPTLLAVPTLDGRIAGARVAGRFAGAAGQIGKVPLRLSAAAGDWSLAGGVLALTGALAVADAAAPARFEPLAARDVALALRGGRIVATGDLVHPLSGRAVAGVTIRHDLAQGAGDARLAVDGIAFDEGFQPEQLTRLTLGVVANVKGRVTGEGRIRWDGQGVTSDGDFTTDGIDLAAAFGPVKGIRAHIHFSDLLALETPAGQSATVAEINPGIAVVEGVIRYRLLAGQQVRIESGLWPFSGGTLALDPTTLDFGRPVDRALTFRVTGMDAAQFVQQFDLKNIALTGTFDGTLPMRFGEKGGRIVGGRLAVRRGGGTLAYVGEVSNAALGTFGKLAFDALKSMRYESLAVELDGALDGDFVTRVLFDGTNETPREARSGLLSQFSNLPFRFRVTIHAPFRGLLNSAASLNDPRGLIRQALPQRTPPLPGSGPVQPSPGVQPPVSEKLR